MSKSNKIIKKSTIIYENVEVELTVIKNYE